MKTIRAEIRDNALVFDDNNAGNAFDHLATQIKINVSELHTDINTYRLLFQTQPQKFSGKAYSSGILSVAQGYIDFPLPSSLMKEGVLLIQLRVLQTVDGEEHVAHTATGQLTVGASIPGGDSIDEQYTGLLDAQIDAIQGWIDNPDPISGYSAQWSVSSMALPVDKQSNLTAAVSQMVSVILKKGNKLVTNTDGEYSAESHQGYQTATIKPSVPAKGCSMQWQISYSAGSKIYPLSPVNFTIKDNATGYEAKHSVMVSTANQGPQGESGVYVGTSEPEDEAVTVWVNPSGTDMAPPVEALAHVTDQLVVPLLITQYGVQDALKTFVEANTDYDDLTSVCNRFFEAAAKTVSGTYTSRFHKFASNSSSVGTKLDANAGLTCTPSTRAAAGTDDYAALPLFACFNVNYTIDAVTLEPVILAIQGITDSFAATPANSLVGVMQMTGWVRRTSDDTTKTVEYRSAEAPGFRPLPEAVRASDNTVRSFVVHAKYAAGYNASGLLSSVSGVQPATERPGSAGSTSISHNGQIAKWREWGNQYCGSSLCDIAFLQLMLEIKYAVLGSSQVMAGCRNYTVSHKAAAAESDVKRILLTSDNASDFVVGSSVSLGSTSSRSEAGNYDVCDIVRIASIEDATVDGQTYKAVNLETETPFDVTTDTYIATHPWRTGSTDDVPGNDGSPTSNTSGKEPCKIQGIEVMLGAYEIPADTTLYVDTEKYTVYLNRKASEIASGNSGTNPITAGTIPKETDTTQKYIAELNWDANDPETYMLPQVFGGHAATGYRAYVQYDGASATGWREWQAFGGMSSVGSGFSGARLAGGIGVAYWSFAARACGSGGNRGKYTPANS